VRQVGQLSRIKKYNFPVIKHLAMKTCGNWGMVSRIFNMWKDRG